MDSGGGLGVEGWPGEGGAGGGWGEEGWLSGGSERLSGGRERLGEGDEDQLPEINGTASDVGGWLGGGRVDGSGLFVELGLATEEAGRVSRAGLARETEEGFVLRLAS